MESIIVGNLDVNNGKRTIIKDCTKEYKTLGGALRFLKSRGFRSLEEELGEEYMNTHELTLSDTEVWTAEVSYNYLYDVFRVNIYF